MITSGPMPRDDKRFHWDFVRFNVDGTQFQVPKRPFLLKSPRFSVLYDLHENSEITLESVGAWEFKAFLKVLSPASCSQPHEAPTTAREVTKSEWTSVLRLSTLWTFPTLHALALKRLNDALTTHPIQRILLGRTHSIKSWVHRGLCELVLRLAEGSSITEEESQSIGHLTTVRVYQTCYEVSRLVPRTVGFSLEVARRVSERFAGQLAVISARELELTPGEGIQRWNQSSDRTKEPGPESHSHRNSSREGASFRELVEQEQHSGEQTSIGRRRSPVRRRHRRRRHAV